MGSAPPLSSVRCAAVDTSPFIYPFEASGPRRERARSLFGASASAPLLTSVITVTEILTFCHRRDDIQLIQRYLEFFQNHPAISVVPVGWQVGLRAAELRARYDLRTHDAIQVASAMENGAEVLITNDRRLLRLADIPVVLFDTWRENDTGP